MLVLTDSAIGTVRVLRSTPKALKASYLLWRGERVALAQVGPDRLLPRLVAALPDTPPARVVARGLRNRGRNLAIQWEAPDVLELGNLGKPGWEASAGSPAARALVRLGELFADLINADGLDQLARKHFATAEAIPDIVPRGREYVGLEKDGPLALRYDRGVVGQLLGQWNGLLLLEEADLAAALGYVERTVFCPEASTEPGSEFYWFPRSSRHPFVEFATGERRLWVQPRYRASTLLVEQAALLANLPAVVSASTHPAVYLDADAIEPIGNDSTLLCAPGLRIATANGDQLAIVEEVVSTRFLQGGPGLLKEGWRPASREMLTAAWTRGAPLEGCSLFPVVPTILPAFLATLASRASLVLASLTEEDCTELVQRGVMRQDRASYSIDEEDAVRLALSRLYPEANGPDTPAADQIGNAIRCLVKAGPFAVATAEERTKLESLIDQMLTLLRALEASAPDGQIRPPGQPL